MVAEENDGFRLGAGMSADGERKLVTLDVLALEFVSQLRKP